MAAAQQFADQVGTDEAGPTGDEHPTGTGEQRRDLGGRRNGAGHARRRVGHQRGGHRPRIPRQNLRPARVLDANRRPNLPAGRADSTPLTRGRGDSILVAPLCALIV